MHGKTSKDLYMRLISRMYVTEVSQRKLFALFKLCELLKNLSCV